MSMIKIVFFCFDPKCFFFLFFPRFFVKRLEEVIEQYCNCQSISEWILAIVYDYFQLNFVFVFQFLTRYSKINEVWKSIRIIIIKSKYDYDFEQVFSSQSFKICYWSFHSVLICFFLLLFEPRHNPSLYLYQNWEANFNQLF